MSKKSANYADGAEDKRRRSNGVGSANGSAKPFNWCNVSLSDAAKEDIGSKEFDAERMFDFLEGLVADGYKITLSYDVKSDCFMVIVVGRLEDRPDFNVGVSSRHSTLTVALLTTQYKFETLFMGGMIPTESISVKGSVWD